MTNHERECRATATMNEGSAKKNKQRKKKLVPTFHSHIGSSGVVYVSVVARCITGDAAAMVK